MAYSLRQLLAEPESAEAVAALKVLSHAANDLRLLVEALTRKE